MTVESSIEKVIDTCIQWSEIRHDLYYDIDGLVIKVDDLTQRNILGATTRNPRWAIAFKFPAEQKETKIEDIVVQVGRTGVLLTCNSYPCNCCRLSCVEGNSSQ